jgi:uncharacterized membrane-anchored protein
MSIIGAILISAGAISYFITTAATAGIYTLFVMGAIGMLAGLASFVFHFLTESGRKHHRE